MIDDLEGYDQAVLGNFIIEVGQVLVTNASQEQRITNIKNHIQMREMQNSIKELQRQVNQNRF